MVSDYGDLNMEAIRSLLSHVRTTGIAPGHFPGLLHVLIGRTITQMNGEVVSRGVTWRECAALLKNARIDPDLVRSLGQDLADLPPRDREKYWYIALTRFPVGGEAARSSAVAMGPWLSKAGLLVSDLG